MFDATHARTICALSAVFERRADSGQEHVKTAAQRCADAAMLRVNDPILKVLLAAFEFVLRPAASVPELSQQFIKLTDLCSEIGNWDIELPCALLMTGHFDAAAEQLPSLVAKLARKYPLNGSFVRFRAWRASASAVLCDNTSKVGDTRCADLMLGNPPANSPWWAKLAAMHFFVDPRECALKPLASAVQLEMKDPELWERAVISVLSGRVLESLALVREISKPLAYLLSVLLLRTGVLLSYGLQESREVVNDLAVDFATLCFKNGELKTGGALLERCTDSELAGEYANRAFPFLAAKDPKSAGVLANCARRIGRPELARRVCLQAAKASSHTSGGIETACELYIKGGMPKRALLLVCILYAGAAFGTSAQTRLQAFNALNAVANHTSSDGVLAKRLLRILNGIRTNQLSAIEPELAHLPPEASTITARLLCSPNSNEEMPFRVVKALCLRLKPGPLRRALSRRVHTI